MYQVIASKQYQKALKKLVKAGLKKKVEEEIKDVIKLLASKKKLGAEYQDHQLQGELREYRECHIQGDLLLVYQIIKDELVLVLVNIGTHSDLF
jgi:mRNA interferase YafQ